MYETVKNISYKGVLNSLLFAVMSPPKPQLELPTSPAANPRYRSAAQQNLQLPTTNPEPLPPTGYMVMVSFLKIRKKPTHNVMSHVYNAGLVPPIQYILSSAKYRCGRKTNSGKKTNSGIYQIVYRNLSKRKGKLCSRM